MLRAKTAPRDRELTVTTPDHVITVTVDHAIGMSVLLQDLPTCAWALEPFHTTTRKRTCSTLVFLFAFLSSKAGFL